MRGLFVTGTDTNAGKTVLCAALMARYRGEARVRYWKPVQTGIEQDDDTAEVRRLGQCSPQEILDAGVRLHRPVSPHLAARLAGITIDLRDLARIPAREPDARWIVEGAGGVLVPLNDREMMADWMRMLRLPVVVATRSVLGTINHTLLTLEALRSRSLHVAGVVMIGDRNAENRAAIEQHGKVEVLGEMPRFESLAPQSLAAWAKAELDPEGQLAELLR